MINIMKAFIQNNKILLSKLNRILEIEVLVNTAVEKRNQALVWHVFVDKNHLFTLNVKSQKVLFSLNAKPK